MDAVTYPDDSVREAIARDVAPYRVNLLERHPDFKEACAGGRVIWSPTFVVSDSRGVETRRWVGWLPPRSFVAELAFCGAMALFNRGKFDEARLAFDVIVERDRGAEIHPEALHWQGVAGFLAGKKDWSALRGSWERLLADYPQTRLATHVSVIEDAPE